jgi:hypothetical protein
MVDGRGLPEEVTPVTFASIKIILLIRSSNNIEYYQKVHKTPYDWFL